MTSSLDTLHDIWRIAGLPDDALSFIDLPGRDPVFPSSFAIGTAAQATIGAAALAACELGALRGVERQRVSVDMTHAAVECTGAFTVDGKEPETWGRFSGLYRCADGYVRIHANFEHHQDGALRLLGLDPETATREDAECALLAWRGRDFENAAAERGLVVTMLRTFDEWDATPQAQAIAAVVKAKGHILVSYDYVTIARSENAGFVGRLYAVGAMLVLDADQAGGCSGLPPKRVMARL